MIPVRHGRNKLPTGCIVRINQNSRFAKNLAMCLVHTGHPGHTKTSADLVTGLRFNQAGTVTSVITLHGEALSFPDPTSSARSTAYAAGYPRTLASAFFSSSGATARSLLTYSNSAAANNRSRLGIGIYNTAGKFACMSYGIGATNAASESTQAFSTTDLNVGVGIVTSNASRQVVLNGIAASVNTTSVSPAGVDTLNIGEGAGSSVMSCMPAQHIMDCVWLDALSVEDAKDFSLNPFQLLEIVPRRLFFGLPSAGTTYTFGVSGSVALSGAAALLKTKLQVPSGSIAFSGTNSLRKTRIQPVSGSIAFSGTAAQAHVKAYAPSGQLVLSGAATLFRIRTQLAAGTLTLSGAAALVRAKVLASSGQVVFSGTAPLSTGTAKILSAGGTIVFAGAASLLRTRQVLPAGTILFSGAQQFARVRNYAPAGTLTFNGTVAQIHTRIRIPVGNVTFSGSSPITFIPFGAPTAVKISRLTTGVNRASRLS